MIATITAPYVDTRAADLVLSLTEPMLPAVAVRTVDLPRAQVELRLLKASHQVVVRRAGNELVETLACLPRAPERLPASYRARCAAGDYGTTVDVHELTAADLAQTVERLLASYADDERYIIGLFPGHPLATTGVGLTDSEPGVVSWRSWHAYPQEQRLVLTRSRLSLRAGDRPYAGLPR